MSLSPESAYARTVYLDQCAAISLSIRASGSSTVWRRGLNSEQRKKDKIEDLESHSRKLRGQTHSGASISTICAFTWVWNSWPSLSAQDSEKYEGQNCPYAHHKAYGVAMAQYGDNNKLLMLAFPRSLRGAALTWFTRLDISNIKKWTDLAHVFVEQYNFNSEIAPNREHLQRMSKKPS